MANHNLPTQSSTYVNFVTELDSRLDDLALGLDPARTTMTNLPVNSVSWSSTENKWKKWTGSAWADLTTGYSININGTAANATVLQNSRSINGVSFNGSANISIPTNTSLTFNSSGSGVSSGTTFDGQVARTISYNTIGAPSITGVGASGTWGINVTGNAATVTNGVYTTGTQDIGGAKTFTGSLAQSVISVPALNIDCSLGNYFTKTIGSSSTFTVSGVPTGAYSFILEVVLTGGSITWFNNINWPFNIAPTLLVNRTHLFIFITDNGGTTWKAGALQTYIE
jgi:hypothetical protein